MGISSSSASVELTGDEHTEQTKPTKCHEWHESQLIDVLDDLTHRERHYRELHKFVSSHCDLFPHSELVEQPLVCGEVHRQYQCLFEQCLSNAAASAGMEEQEFANRLGSALQLDSEAARTLLDHVRAAEDYSCFAELCRCRRRQLQDAHQNELASRAPVSHAEREELRAHIWGLRLRGDGGADRLRGESRSRPIPSSTGEPSQAEMHDQLRGEGALALPEEELCDQLLADERALAASLPGASVLVPAPTLREVDGVCGAVADVDRRVGESVATGGSFADRQSMSRLPPIVQPAVASDSALRKDGSRGGCSPAVQAPGRAKTKGSSTAATAVTQTSAVNACGSRQYFADTDTARPQLERRGHAKAPLTATPALDSAPTRQSPSMCQCSRPSESPLHADGTFRRSAPPLHDLKDPCWSLQASDASHDAAAPVHTTSIGAHERMATDSWRTQPHNLQWRSQLRPACDGRGDGAGSEAEGDGALLPDGFVSMYDPERAARRRLGAHAIQEQREFQERLFPGGRHLCRTEIANAATEATLAEHVDEGLNELEVLRRDDQETQDGPRIEDDRLGDSIDSQALDDLLRSMKE